MDREKLIQRVLKLFKLGDAARNTSEAEVMAAVTKAKQLMLEHDLEMAEVMQRATTEQARAASVVIEYASAYTVKGSFAQYDSLLAAAVDYICGTRNVTQRYVSGHISRLFVGDVTDVRVAAQLFMALLSDMRRHAREYIGRGWSSSHTSYCLGYSYRLYERAKAEVDVPDPVAAASVALVRTTKTDAIDRWLRAQKVEDGKRRKIRVRDPMAMWAGQRRAESVDLQRTGRLKEKR